MAVGGGYPPIGSSTFNSFLFNVARGKIPGHSLGTVFGHNPDIDPAASETIWDFGGNFNYLTADTELYLSSASAADTNVTVLITGLTEDYSVKTLVHTHTLGQAQESVGVWFRINKMTVIGGEAPLGDLYLAESDTLTAGVPDTPTKVQDWMELGINTTHRSMFTVPANHTFYATRLFLGVRRGEDCVFIFTTRGSTHPAFITHAEFPVYQSTMVQAYEPFFTVPEKTDIEFRGKTITNNTAGTANFAYLLVDNTYG